MFTLVETLPCRRNVANLLPSERTAFVAAVKAAKAAGDYDPFVLVHQDAMDHGTPSGTSPGTRNAAHRGPAFLPWHREFLRRFEEVLRALDPVVAVPYWDWAGDAALADPAAGVVWGSDLMGGNGDPALGDVIQTGPFRDGEWTIVNSAGTVVGPLHRQFGDSAPTLPTQADVNGALAETPYDATPWNTSSNPSFRNRLEGWIGGPALHNRVHVWVGGDMLPGTSPNDPVFFLHHCFVDKLWGDWQAQHPTEGFLPMSGGPTGHNVADAMYPWPTKASDVLDHVDLCMYDTDPPRVSLITPALAFVDVPEAETTYRAVVFEVTTCQQLALTVTAGPGAGFGVLSPTVLVDPGRQAVRGEARIWVSYTGTSAGNATNGSVTVTAVETGESWTLPITASTVARPTAAVVMALDQSGSMDDPSGIGSLKRVDVLRYSATPFANLIQEGNALGIIRFDETAHDAMPVTGPLGPPGAFDPDRPTAMGLIAAHATNPAGLTSIGSALQRSHDLLIPEPYDIKATVVLTDGFQTARPWIADVAGTVNERVYAIGVGTPENLQPGALQSVVDGTNGFLYLTGELNEDSYFRVAKYYLQILAGVTNDQIVVDPDGWVSPGAEVRVPFTLTDADISADVVLLAPAPWALDFRIETAGGDIIDPGVATGLPGVEFAAGDKSAFYRVGLPVPAAQAHAGVWHALLKVEKRQFEKYLGSLDNFPDEMRRARAHGVRYSVSVQAHSNVRLQAWLGQASHEPGAHLTLTAQVSESDLPIPVATRVRSQVTTPLGVTSTVVLDPTTNPGWYAATVEAQMPGVYQIRVLAEGRTLRGQPFTREHSLTGYVFTGGDDRPEPPGGHDLCDVIRCILSGPSVEKFLRRHEIDAGEIRTCACP